MVSPSNDSLGHALERLKALDNDHLQIAKQMFESFGGKLYGMDLLAAGALNRSMSLILGFGQLIEAKNLICAGALLRLQLDTALRFYAAFLVENPHEFALAVLEGKHVRNLKDQQGVKMTDAYLVEQLGKEFNWVPRVYERTSSYVHLSSTHIMSATVLSRGKEDPDQSISIRISSEHKPLPDAIWIEAVDAFLASTEILLTYVRGWVFTKANPKLVREWKVARESQQRSI